MERVKDSSVKDRQYALAAMQTQILYDVANMLEEAVSLLKQVSEALERPKGHTHQLSLTVDSLVVVNFLRDRPYSKLMSVTVFNDGPDDVYVSVNTYQKVTPIRAGESADLSFGCPVIENLYLDVDEGRRASVRIIGVY